MKTYEKGMRVRTLVTDIDLDEVNRERLIPIGTLGTITTVERDGDDGDMMHDIAWDNGAWTRWTASELAKDAEVFRVPYC